MSGLWSAGTVMYETEFCMKLDSQWPSGKDAIHGPLQSIIQGKYAQQLDPF